jgi:hypothetical protein
MTLEQLVIRNLVVLEQVPAVADKVDETIMRHINDIVMLWAKEMGWLSKPETEDNFCQFSPIDWPTEEQDSKVFYELDSTASNYYDLIYWTSALTGAVPFEFGFWLSVDTKFITRIQRAAAAKSAWNSFLAQQIQKRPQLHEIGFRLVKNKLFLPVLLNASDIADNYPETLNDALAPITDTLKKIEDAHPVINGIIKEAVIYFPE